MDLMHRPLKMMGLLRENGRAMMAPYRPDQNEIATHRLHGKASGYLPPGPFQLIGLISAATSARDVK